jgi:menaquinone-dependent protoporphyrinogen oxidase
LTARKPAFRAAGRGRNAHDLRQRQGGNALLAFVANPRETDRVVANILLLYSTVYGLSKTICERIQASLRERGDTAVVAPLAGGGVDPASFDAIVIGASIKHGKHHPSVLEFIRSHRSTLETKPSALFSVNLVARKPARNTPQTNPYLKRLVAKSPWKPKLQGVFAGELDYSRYGPLDKQMMRFVMWINKGPTDPSTRVQFTDWNAVERFAGQVAALANGRGPGA